MRKKDKEIKDEDTIESVIERANACRIGLSENNVSYFS
jgi:nitroimidazol reductase NimA-like FMN-containing flavoprotein (pyridoxamine 5'-phosphate oxidase superfamily)